MKVEAADKLLESWPADEIPLTGGRITPRSSWAEAPGGVVRIGDTVRRPCGPHTPFAHRLLRHLEQVGFEGAPRLLGIDHRGREIRLFCEAYGLEEKAGFTNSILKAQQRVLARFQPKIDHDPYAVKAVRWVENCLAWVTSHAAALEAALT